MKRIPIVGLMMYGLLAASASLSSIPSAQAADVTNLRCEYLVNPLGIDVVKPRLSWVIESARRGEQQTAYQILVASSEALLKKDKGDLWDSGKVVSEQSVAVLYAGASLASETRYWWKVWVYDQDGKGSAWSAPASFLTGKIAGFTPGKWHHLAVSLKGGDMLVTVDGKEVARVHNEGYPGRKNGMAYLMSGYDPNCFDNVSVTP